DDAIIGCRIRLRCSDCCGLRRCLRRRYSGEPERGGITMSKAAVGSLPAASLAAAPAAVETSALSREASAAGTRVGMDRAWRQKFVLVHSGARDSYQLARALSE